MGLSLRCGTTTGLPPASDPEHEDMLEQSPKKASKQILRHEIEEGIDALERPAVGCSSPVCRPGSMLDSASS